MAKPARKPVDPRRRVIDRTLSLAAERGWRRVSLGDIAAAAKLPLAELYRLYPSRTAILAAFVRRIDETVLEGGEAEGATPRERLFDLLMRRFEALRPYKDGVAAILRDCGGDPLALLCGGARLKRSMSWTLEAAGLSSHGLLGQARAKGLAVVYLATLRRWLADDTADMSRTMAALDKHLSRAEALAGLCGRLGGRGPRRASEAAAAA
jgi:AcrR family transcriptional regulator